MSFTSFHHAHEDGAVVEEEGKGVRSGGRRRGDGGEVSGVQKVEEYVSDVHWIDGPKSSTFDQTFVMLDSLPATVSIEK